MVGVDQGTGTTYEADEAVVVIGLHMLYVLPVFDFNHYPACYFFSSALDSRLVLLCHADLGTHNSTHWCNRFDGVICEFDVLLDGHSVPDF